jgi:hypothetical protein
LSFEYFAGRLFCQHKFGIMKNPLWRGQTQLSVSDPNLPIDVGGAPTTHIRKVSVTKEGIDCPHKGYNFVFLPRFFREEALNRVMFS